ncbi:MAG: TRAM domain-containing protein [Halobacteriales archaeon]|nr:TRAM domain-containing protein [Halobacteriales archaeon]
MPDCPLADDCPSFSERIEGLGCQHYGNRGGAEWCNHYDMPISDLKQQPVKAGEVVEVDVTDIHESGAGVGHTDDGFVVFIDGVLPPARSKVEITNVKSNHARGRELERLPDEPEEEPTADDAEEDPTDVEAETTDEDEDGDADDEGKPEPQLGSRDNFWGG